MTHATVARKQVAALLRYRVMAYVTGTLLVLLVFVAVPLQVFADRPALADILGTAHGFLFIAYLVAATDLGIRRRWPLPKFGLVLVSGTIPFLGFYMERRISGEIARGAA